MQKILYRNFVLILASDIVLVALSWYFAHLLRFNFTIPPDNFQTFLRLLPLLIGIKVVIFFFLELHQGMWRYTSVSDLGNVIRASSVASAFIIVLILFSQGFGGYSRSVFILDWGLTVILIGGYRLGIRLYFSVLDQDERVPLRWKYIFSFLDKERRVFKKLLIIGAGDCGEKIYREIHDNSQLGYQVVGFMDDDPGKARRKIHGIPVLGHTDQLKSAIQKMNVEELLIAIPSASSIQMRAIIAHCKEAGVPFKTVPGMGELIDGRVTVKSIRDVAYRDLLGRETVRLDEERIGAYLKGAKVLVTGAGGSIGSELCRQICRFKPDTLILYERAESALFEIDLELKENYPQVKIIPALADIRDRQQLSRVFSDTGPRVVFHAAAYKHVPMMELHPWKAVKNNIFGTRNVVEISKECLVDRFVFVSTDKAVRPVNVMGASKRVAELLVQGQNGFDSMGTKFMTVRFGNVVGSVGSVVPIFKKQIEKGGPVTVTDPEMTRYFMTIPESCQLILQAGAMGEGGEIFVLDMGTPVKIDDMARDLIRLSGYEPDVDIEIAYIGLRPGEKLYEELITEGEGIVPTSHEKIMVIRGQASDQERLNARIDELAPLAYEQDTEGLRLKLQEVVEVYEPRG